MREGKVRCFFLPEIYSSEKRAILILRSLQSHYGFIPNCLVDV